MIDEKIKSGYKKIVICAPTGSGKSPIAATLAKAFKSSFIVTASKSLQDQYQNDFSFLKPIKGKPNSFVKVRQIKLWIFARNHY